MLIPTFKIRFILLLLSAGLFFSCGKDDGPAPILEDDDEIIVDDDPNPTGFQGDIDFVKTFGGSNEETATSIVLANDGNYMVLGTTKSMDGDLVGRTGDDNDYWLLKISPEGVIIWSKTYGGSADDVATSISKTSDGGYVLSGHSRSSDGGIGNEGFHDYLLFKITANGTEQWHKNYGFSGSDQATKIFETAEGNFFATGFFDVSASGGAGNDFQNTNQTNQKGGQHGVGEYWGILMDGNGNKIWRRYFGGSNNDRSYDALQTDDGGFLMIGASESTDFDITDDKGSYDFWAVRLSPQGDLLWTKSFGGSEIDVAYSVTKTLDGNYLMVGDSRSSDKDVTGNHGNADVWVVKFNDLGNMIWQKTYGGTEFESARSIKPLANGGYVITGFTRSSDGDVTINKGQNDLWVLLIDENGGITLETTIGGSVLDFGFDVIQTPDNKIIAVGNTESNNLDIPQNRGIKDLLLVKLK
ncbi:hypothetical protein [Ulvibacter antarcticus]|uniref:Bulb-type lectin domain-containing protein n=1 Tax=Ulvibacter antarcticus TaxID=442714 RepID=A0A3L9YYL7_9FLAO|nr:hypothetical protein [Ulvibacter antarcticus]RMA65821.1 hypothetical protein BXY75_0234 [Ulvibacter antarcticus]